MKDIKQFCDEIGINRTPEITKICELYASEFARDKVKEAVKLAQQYSVGWEVKHKYTEQEILEKLKL